MDNLIDHGTTPAIIKMQPNPARARPPHFTTADSSDKRQTDYGTCVFFELTVQHGWNDGMTGKCAQEVLLSARPAREALRVRVRGGVAGHFAPRIRHEAGVGGVVAALREVPAQAGLEHSAGVALVVALFVGAAACQVIRHDELEHFVGELVERDHGESGGIAVIGSVE